MPTNKNATTRYLALDRCFSNPVRKYDINSLVEACNEALLDIDPNSSGVKKRQVYKDIKFMCDSRGYDAPIETYKEGRRVYYRYFDINYSISNQPLNEKEAMQLKELLQSLTRFKGLPKFEWIDEIKARLEQSFSLKTVENVLSFDENPYLTGCEYISNLYDAIINKDALLIEYKTFNSEESNKITIHPYHLKQYNNRWFLFGLNHELGTISNLALDRVRAIEKSRVEYTENKAINFEEYFEDVIGVSINPEKSIEKVLLKVKSKQWNYIKTKPWHGSQKTIKITDDYTIFQLELRINYELEALILSFGEGIEVLEPEGFRQIINDRIKRASRNYT